MAKTDEAEEEALPEGIESWISAPDAATQYGTTAAQLTRAAQDGTLRRTRVKRPGDQRPVYVYDPATLEEARANGQLGAPLQPAAEGMLMGGAVMLGKMTELVSLMSTRLVASFDAITRANEAQSRAQAAQADAFLRQFERLDKRNEVNERVVLDYIQARNEMANEKAEIDLEAAKQEHSATMRAAALQALIEHAGSILELGSELLKIKKSVSDETQDAPKVDAPAEPVSASGEKVIDVTSESKPLGASSE